MNNKRARALDSELQLSLLDLPQTVQPEESGATLREKFEAFHAANPHVYRALRTLALQLKRRGRNRYGMKGLFEVTRWQYSLQTDDPEGFKLNNNYTAFYARMLMADVPELDGFFETREQKCAGSQH